MKFELQDLIDYGQTLRGADVYYRESWSCTYFSLMGKCFGMMKEDMITLKGNPEENKILRASNPAITPGYYANKVHWNSFHFGEDNFSKETLEAAILKSYTLVYQGLSRKDKEILEEISEDL